VHRSLIRQSICGVFCALKDTVVDVEPKSEREAERTLPKEPR
jgi:hypothetical protein